MTYKFDEDGYLIRYKARLVVRGDLKPPSDQDTYAATLAIRVLRTLLAIVAYFDLEIWQFDAVSAFTNAPIDELVYVRYPEGFARQGWILKLLRALYGLPVSPLLWYNHLVAGLREEGLHPVPETSCLFISDKLMVFFYVDDIAVIFHPDNRDAFVKFRTNLMNRWTMHEVGELEWFLSIRIIRDRSQRKIWLLTDAHADKVAKAFDIDDAKPPKTPMRLEPFHSYKGTATPEEKHLFQRMCGNLTYAATATHPELANTAKTLASFQQNPGPEHIEAAYRAIRFYVANKYLALEMGGSINTGQMAFLSSSDASFADHTSTRRSTEGYLNQLFNGSTHWISRYQHTVTTSSTEAELLSLSHLAAWVIWWLRFFNHIKLNLGHEIVIYCDNQQTIRLLTKEDQKLVTKLKHIDVH